MSNQQWERDKLLASLSATLFPVVHTCRNLCGSPAVRRSIDGTGSSTWLMPLEDRYKINSDGARNESDGNASCGGVIRDHNGYRKLGFSMFIGVCIVLEAEQWLLEIVGTYSTDAIRLITGPSSRQKSHSVFCCILERCNGVIGI
ncbi:hypothetical protein V6N12_056108 [Hibiscus sabdariffa]|uniref:RNase H type-1 domain-containing protein n=1 Tax=Hibiscus sabdariffa TaxID=183260 RepID=A0ABR2CRK8_9ROSI